MSSFSDFLENKILDHVFGSVAYAAPVTFYLAAYTAAPSDAGGGTEVTGGAYARVAITNNAVNFPASAGGAKSNGTVITFPTATASWGTVTHLAIMDAASAGNQIGWSPLTLAKLIDTADTMSVPVGSLALSLT